jgi:CheY-like chemotaxis protein
MQKAFEVIHVSATRATRVIKQLALFFSPHDRECKESVNLKDVLEEAVELTRPLWKEQKEAEGVRISLETNLLDVEPIDGDPHALREALTNLLINAVDALPSGGALWCSTGMEDNQVVLRIRDNGTGMDPDTLRYCFEPFFSTKPEAPGMGLAVVHGTVERHEGEIDIQTDPGKGTTVTLRFKAVAPRPPKAPSSVADPSDLPRLSILTADDDEAVSTVMARMLEIYGHEVTRTSSGLDVVREFTQGTYDMVITDRAMPDLNGDEVARRIKEFSPHMPVLMITGFGSMMKERGEHPEYVDLILNKPYTKDELFGAIAELLETSGACSAQGV